MTPDFERAASAAMRILINHAVTETPVVPLPILLRFPGVRVMSFSTLADNTEIDRQDLVPMFGSNLDAATFHLDMPGLDDVRYVVVYNMRLPFEVIWRGIARELGHIVLGHDGASRTAEVRLAEAMCFAHNLLSPRPVIRMLQESGIPLTMNVLSSVTCCSDECVVSMRRIPGVRTPIELNLRVRELFSRGIHEYVAFHKASPRTDNSPLVDFGSYMEGYEE